MSDTCLIRCMATDEFWVARPLTICYYMLSVVYNNYSIITSECTKCPRAGAVTYTHICYWKHICSKYKLYSTENVVTVLLWQCLLCILLYTLEFSSLGSIFRKPVIITSYKHQRKYFTYTHCFTTRHPHTLCSRCIAHTTYVCPCIAGTNSVLLSNSWYINVEIDRNFVHEQRTCYNPDKCIGPLVHITHINLMQYCSTHVSQQFRVLLVHNTYIVMIIAGVAFQSHGQLRY